LVTTVLAIISAVISIAATATKVGVAVAAKKQAQGGGGGAKKEGCYDGLSLVRVLREDGLSEVTPIGELAVGDFVFDGSEFSKVYFLQNAFPQDGSVEMLQIHYGVPSEEHSITLTPAHLLYREAAPLPVRSEEVRVGDTLWGATEYSHGDGFNFTVYAISTVQRVPVNPITVSSDLMVNGVRTSVFSHSVQNRDALHGAAAIFRWTSANIDEAVTQKLVGFYYNTVYQGMMTGKMQELTMANGAVLGAVYGAIPLVVAIAAFKAARTMFADRSTAKRC